MYIHEAAAATSKSKPFITRRAWRNIVLSEAHRTAIKIQPTDTPVGCIIESAAIKGPRAGWQPRAEDLMAEDGEIVSV